MSTETQTIQGRADVMDALIGAATTLFAEQGIAGTSVRSIAAAAGVNHGLLHRHFGSKEGLLRAVMRRLQNEVTASMPPERPDETITDVLYAAVGPSQQLHSRIVARAMLEGRDPLELQEDFPVVKRLLKASMRSSGTLTPEARVALILSTSLGLLTFQNYLREAIGQDELEWTSTCAELMRYATANTKEKPA